MSLKALDSFDQEVLAFSTVEDFHKKVLVAQERFSSGRSLQQFLAFTGVTSKTFSKIDSDRTRGTPKGVRLTYDADENVLILRMVGIVHELAHRNFEAAFYEKLAPFGITWRSLPAIGSARIQGIRGGSRSKEADSAYKPLTRPQSGDFPTVVVECGVLESLRLLRNDARLWLSQGASLVRIVVIIMVDEATRSMIIEKWDWSDSIPQPQPTLAQEISINSTTVTNAPLSLDIEDITAAPPINPQQRTIHFSSGDLRSLYDVVFGAVQ